MASGVKGNRPWRSMASRTCVVCRLWSKIGREGVAIASRMLRRGGLVSPLDLSVCFVDWWPLQMPLAMWVPLALLISDTVVAPR
jgi:hypothetical protein